MKYLWVLFLLFQSVLVLAQKEQTIIIDAGRIKSIFLNADQVFNVVIKSHDISEIQIHAQAEGVLSINQYLSSSFKGEVLNLGTAFQPAFINYNDKLSAHKVSSFSIRIKVPRWLSFQIISTTSNVLLCGSLFHFKASLQSGFCKLYNFRGDAEIETSTGDIWAEIKSGKVSAESKNGVLDMASLPLGKNTIRLRSIDGNIKVTHSR